MSADQLSIPMSSGEASLYINLSKEVFGETAPVTVELRSLADELAQRERPGDAMLQIEGETAAVLFNGVRDYLKQPKLYSQPGGPPRAVDIGRRLIFRTVDYSTRHPSAA